MRILFGVLVAIILCSFARAQPGSGKLVFDTDDPRPLADLGFPLWAEKNPDVAAGHQERQTPPDPRPPMWGVRPAELKSAREVYFARYAP